MRILWCITGGGHLLEESCAELETAAKEHEVTVAFSRAGREVASAYGCFSRIEKSAKNVAYEEQQGYSNPIVGRLGRFDAVVVSPCTANTAAKIRYGIADSLASNIVAQALKAGIRVAIVPTDSERLVETRIPSGRKIRIRCRRTDLENLKKLRKSEGIAVLKHPDGIKRFLKNVD
jgi:dihydromethanopterin reductase (acceptor)